jgi:predicted transcriptional regulator
LKKYLEDIRGRLLERALEISGGNKTKAAALLNLTPQAVSQSLRKKD